MIRIQLTKMVIIGCLAFASNPVLADDISFDWVTVGNPNNLPHTRPGSPRAYGDVSYVYRISKHEVTNAQYTSFLNAVDAAGTNPNSIYNSNMESDAIGGITFNSASANGAKYLIKSGRGNNPVVWVSFYDSMRFTNWLQNGQGTGGTEFGVYEINTGLDETRAAGADYFIPTENEWYKAAYYNPNTASYFDQATSSDAITSEAPIGGPTSANFKDSETGYALTGELERDFDFNYLTDVGDYSTTLSPYGTFDQGGNVREFTESIHRIFPDRRSARGGSWLDSAIGTSARATFSVDPSFERSTFGFRVGAVSVPEPSSLLFGSLAIIGLLLRRRR